MNALIQGKLLNPLLLKSFSEHFGFKSLTPSQGKALPLLLGNLKKDIVLRAPTGSGKTLSYILSSAELNLRSPSKGVGTLIVVPRRELAHQVAKEARGAMKFSPESRVCCLAPGSSRSEDISDLVNNQPEVVVGTIARLSEHVRSTMGFRNLFKDVNSIVFDEVDELVEKSHESEISSLMTCLPPKSRRRTILVSATISEDVKRLGASLIKPDYLYIDCSSTEVSHIQQSFVIVPGSLLFSSLINAINLEISSRPFAHKILVFFPTCKSAELASKLCAEFFPVTILTGQSEADERERASRNFRNSTNGIMFTTDVSSRGVDYENISLVIQFLTPSSHDIYMHRIGRTGRGGRTGRALLIIHHKERAFLRRVDKVVESEISSAFFCHKNISSWEHDSTLGLLAEEAHLSLISYFRGVSGLLGIGQSDAISIANDFVTSAGLTEPPKYSL